MATGKTGMRTYENVTILSTEQGFPTMKNRECEGMGYCT
jgi:hypothetical protein